MFSLLITYHLQDSPTTMMPDHIELDLQEVNQSNCIVMCLYINSIFS